MLKFSLDKFADIIWGFPVKLETDCQVLQDVLLNDTLHATHACWQDGVLAYNIVDVQHVPGTSNIADGISWQYFTVPHLVRTDSARTPSWPRIPSGVQVES